MNRRGVWWALAAGLAAAAALIALQMTSGPQGGPSGGEKPRSAAYWEGLPTAGLTIGDVDAPVLVEEYFDFQCPHCQRAADEIVKPFIESVVARGEARFAYRFFPILGPESEIAARGAYCAAKQGQFWPFQAILFARKGTGNRGTYAESKLRTYAQEADLDLDLFDACLASEEAAVYVAGAYQRGVQLGIPGTPTFFVNGEPVRVASLTDLRRIVEEASGGAQEGR